MKAETDVIVVGGGSSGCLAAARLVAETGLSVELLEAGGAYRNPFLRIAAGYMKYLARDTYLTMHKAEPASGLAGRAPIIPQARILGGGSSVNAMVYMRGQPADYDGWARITGADWGWTTMLRHFVRLENNSRLVPPTHGRDGPLKVSDSVHVCEMTRLFLRTMSAMGVPETEDFNAGWQTGAGLMQVTASRGWRCSVADAFLYPMRANRRLKVRLRTPVRRLVLEGSRIAGVETSLGVIRARHGVILAAGALVTPQLLMLSGIGPAEELAKHGIKLRIDAPGVGRNLQDHLEAPIVATTRTNSGYFGEDRGLRMLWNGLRFLATGTGPAGTIGVEACAFMPESSGDAALQIYCVPTVYLDRDVTGVEPRPGLTLNACLLRPRSRGLIGLRTGDPSDPPLIKTGSLDNPADLDDLRRGLGICREILATHPLAGEIDAEIFPGPAVRDSTDLDSHIRRSVKTNYHPCGTVRMGHSKDAAAPLAPDGRLKGIEGLWVVDASAMPSIPSGNTNAPVLAMSDRLVDGIASSLT